jgi:hypothetical protein
MFKLKPVSRFRRQRIKACATCKYLIVEGRTPLTTAAGAPARARRGLRPVWRNTWQFYYHQLYEYVCDRWVKKET